MKEKIAILMATYNGEKYISEQIDSIIKQTYTNWSLFISDDGSVDKTMDIVNKYVEQYPDKIFIVQGEKEKHGAKENFDFLLQNVKDYEYYMFSDQDDVWLDRKIEILMDEMMKQEDKSVGEEAVLIFSDVKVVDETLKTMHDSFLNYCNLYWDEKNIFINCLIHNYAPGCSMLFNRKLYETAGRVPSDAAMHDYWCILVAAALGTVVYVESPQVLYRQHSSNCMGAKDGKWNVWRLNKSFQKTNIEKLRKEKREKLYMARAIKDKFEMELSTDDLAMLKNFIRCLESANLLKVLWLKRKYKLKIGANYMFLLSLKV